MQKTSITLEKLFFATKCCSKAELAEKLDVTYGALRHAEINSNPSMDGRILKVAAENDISTDWLFGINGKIPNIPEYATPSEPTAQ